MATAPEPNDDEIKDRDWALDLVQKAVSLDVRDSYLFDLSRVDAEAQPESNQRDFTQALKLLDVKQPAGFEGNICRMDKANFESQRIKLRTRFISQGIGLGQ